MNNHKTVFWPPPLIFFILYFTYNVIFIILGFSLFQHLLHLLLIRDYSLASCVKNQQINK